MDASLLCRQTLLIPKAAAETWPAGHGDVLLMAACKWQFITLYSIPNQLPVVTNFKAFVQL